MTTTPTRHVGIDLGGTKTEAILLDSHGIELARQRIQTPRGNYQTLIKGLCDFIHDFTQPVNASWTLGIGTPGSLGVNGVMRNANTVELNGQPFRQDLEAVLGRTVFMENDANCFVLSEAVDGAAKDGNTVFGAILGTGVGGGIVINKQLLSGSNKISGEWGHISLPSPNEDEFKQGRYSSKACYCGRAGCIETYLSGPGLATTYQNISGNTQTAEDIVKLAASNDPHAEIALQCYEEQLAKSLAMIVNVLDPDVIVLGGGLSKVERFYANVPLLWKRYIFSDSIKTRLSPPQHGDSSGVRGAALLGFSHDQVSPDTP